MPTITYGQAVQQALDQAMTMDERVFLAGEGVGVSIHADPNMPTHGLLEKHGPRRVKDTPVSEAAIAGLAVGAACQGLLPVVEIMFLPFITLATDMLVNHAAKLRYLSGGKSSFPLTVRVKAGIMPGPGCQHCHNLEAWLAHVPGLKVAWAATPADAKGLLLSAIFDPDPCVVIEEMPQYWTPGEVPEGDHRVPLGRARLALEGEDCTVAAWGGAVPTALQAAEELTAQGVRIEVLDLRSLAPMDTGALFASVRKTGRLVVVHEATRFAGLGAEVAALAAEECWDELKAPVRRVAAPDIPVPFTPPQIGFYKPSPNQVAETVLGLVRS
jgi:pyruvate dehydrogenase E1 component beta subunit